MDLFCVGSVWPEQRALFKLRLARNTPRSLRREIRWPQWTRGKREPDQAIPRRLLTDAEGFFGVEYDEARDVVGGVDVTDLRVIPQSVIGQLLACGDEPPLADVIEDFVRNSIASRGRSAHARTAVVIHLIRRRE